MNTLVAPREKDYADQAAYCRALEQHCEGLLQEVYSTKHCNCGYDDVCEFAREADGLQEELAALKNLITNTHKAKGRYHSQIAWANLYEACGLTFINPAREKTK